MSPNHTYFHKSSGGSGIENPRLTVFSDDWGRHPSSSQHIVRQLAGRWDVTWVNTIGMRWPGLNREDVQKVARKLAGWCGMGKKHAGRAGHAGGAARQEEMVRVCHPVMYPGFRAGWQRRVNRGLIEHAVRQCWSVRGAGGDGGDDVVLTTLPVCADLVGRLGGRWVYYCVDDFGSWPGVDQGVMREMEAALVKKVDAVVCVSETLVQRMIRLGRGDAVLLTHGIDVGHWQGGKKSAGKQGGNEDGLAGDERMMRRKQFGWARDVYGPLYLFWGLIDKRLDVAWVAKLGEAAAREGGRLVLLGPEQSPAQGLFGKKGVMLGGRMGYEQLPAAAGAADVLVMPYVDEAVTRAMQPLKLKEYLATGLPVVCRDLPATRLWADGCDVAGDVDAFVAMAEQRAAVGATARQLAARQRLSRESWSEKAKIMEGLLIGSGEVSINGVAA